MAGSSKDLRKVLDKARALYEDRPDWWSQGVYGKTQRGHEIFSPEVLLTMGQRGEIPWCLCAVGMLYFAAGQCFPKSDDGKAESMAIEAVLRCGEKVSMRFFYTWNDEVGRNVKDVTNLFNSVART